MDNERRSHLSSAGQSRPGVSFYRGPGAQAAGEAAAADHSAAPYAPSVLREPHYKHFTLERYRSFYEVRAKNGIAVRIIFTILPEGKTLLLYGFSKRQSRDTMRALEQSMRILAEFREHPEHAVEYKIKEEPQ